MRFANEPAFHTRFAQVIAQRLFTNPQRETVPCSTVRGHVAACVKAHPTSTTNGGLGISVGKPNALGLPHDQNLAFPGAGGLRSLDSQTVVGHTL